MPFLGPTYGYENISGTVKFFGPLLSYAYPESNANASLALRDNAARTRISIQFMVGASGNLSAIDVYLKGVGTLNGDISCSIYADSSGVPTGSALATSVAGEVAANNLNTVLFSRERFTFATPLAVTGGVVYHAVFEGTYAISASDYVLFETDSTPANPLRNAVHNGTSWSTNSAYGIILAYINAVTPLWQGFTVTGNHSVLAINIVPQYSGTPSGNLIIELLDGSLNHVDGGVSSPVPVSDVIAGASSIAPFFQFAFPSNPQLQDGQQYYMKISTTGADDASNYTAVGVDNTTTSYSGGTLSRFVDGIGLVDEDSTDLIFQVYYVDEDLPTNLSDELALFMDPPSDCRAQQTYLKGLVNVLAEFFPSILPPIYGGTGAGQYAIGDMLYATDIYHLERLPIGSPGQRLSVGQDNLPTWVGSGSIVTQNFFNNSGLQLDPGDVVVFDGTNDDSVQLTTTARNRLFAGIVADVIPAGQYGPVTTQGEALVRVQGTVTRGDYLHTSGTARRAASIVISNSVSYGAAPIRAIRSGVSGDLVKCYVNSPVRPASPQGAHYNVDQVSNYQTTSATFTDVDGTNLALPLTYLGGAVLVGFHGNIIRSTSPQRIYFDVNISGGIGRIGGDDGITGILDPANAVPGTPIEFVRRIAGGTLTPGTAYTISLQWKQAGGTVTMYSGAGTANADLHPQFWVQEFF